MIQAISDAHTSGDLIEWLADLVKASGSSGRTSNLNSMRPVRIILAAFWGCRRPVGVAARSAQPSTDGRLAGNYLAKVRGCMDASLHDLAADERLACLGLQTGRSVGPWSNCDRA